MQHDAPWPTPFRRYPPSLESVGGDSQMRVSITIVRAIIDELRRRGIAEAEILGQAGIDPEELADATSRISVERYEQAVASALALSADRALGLRVAWAAPAGALHVVGHLLVNCPTMRDAIAQFFRFSSLILEGTRWELWEDEEDAHFVYAQQLVTSPDHARFDAEFCLTLVLKLGFQLIGAEPPPKLVRFRHAAPDYASSYHPIFGSVVLFGEPVNEIVFKRRYLDLPQMHRDETVRDLLRGRADELLAQRSSDDRLADRIGVLLRSDVDLAAVDLGHLAQRLGTTPRSLQRRLRERGVSLSELCETAKRDVACAALNGRDVAIKDLAYRLGFSEPSAFHRAFKRWTGTTPAEYRRRAQGRAV
jgi:AraC-like DNA-binding protein